MSLLFEFLSSRRGLFRGQPSEAVPFAVLEFELWFGLLLSVSHGIHDRRFERSLSGLLHRCRGGRLLRSGLASEDICLPAAGPYLYKLSDGGALLMLSPYLSWSSSAMRAYETGGLSLRRAAIS